MIKIEHRGDGSVICTGVTVRQAVKKAIKRDGYLKYAVLRGADLSGLDLSDGLFNAADLEDADLRDTDLTNTQFGGTCLRGVKLDGAVIDDTFFCGANLRCINFGRVDLTTAKF